MAIDQESFNVDLYKVLKTRGYKPVPKDAKNQRTQPEAAEVFNFTFMKDGKDYGDAWVTIDNASNVVLYYSNEQEESPSGKSPGLDYDDSWSGLKRHLKQWSMNKQLTFELRNKDELGDDMAQRDYVKKKEKMNEAYHPMGKKASYNDNIPAVKIILQHNRQIEEGEQRYRNIAKIFLENQDGERFLAPTTRPGIAQVYARHIAEGGVPNDERWNHIKSICEEYSKMAGFVRATKNKQFNESAQSLVNEGINHYQSLRETLGKLRGHRGYNQYFESWTPALMEDDVDGTQINELFVQETVDPRIESVMPILSRLYKKTGETPVKEVKELEQWADSIVEGEETLEEDSDTSPVEAAILRRIAHSRTDLLKHGIDKVMAAVKEVADFVGDVEEIGTSDVSGWIRQVEDILGHEEIDEAKSDSFRRKFNKAMSWDYSNPKEMIKKIRSYTDQDLLDLYHHPEEEQKLDGSARALQLKLIRQELKRRYGLTPKGNIKPEETLEEGSDASPVVRAIINKILVGRRDLIQQHGADKVLDAINDVADLVGEVDEIGTSDDGYWVKEVERLLGHKEENPDLFNEGTEDDTSDFIHLPPDIFVLHTAKAPRNSEQLWNTWWKRNGFTADEKTNLLRKGNDLYRFNYDKKGLEKVKTEFSEGLDKNQKKAGQLGPTEKVGKKGAVGKLVGANESIDPLAEIKRLMK